MTTYGLSSLFHGCLWLSLGFPAIPASWLLLEWLWRDTSCLRAEKPQQDGRCWSGSSVDRLWRDTPHPRAKEKPQQDCRRGAFAFRIKPHSYQRHSEGSNKPCVHQDPENPQRLRQNCEHLLWRYGSAVDCRRSRGSGFSSLGYGISPLGGGLH